MSYLDDFKVRLNVSGNTSADSQVNTTSQFITSHFAESPFYRIAKWNGSDLELQLADVNSVSRSSQIMPIQYGIKFALFKPNIVMDLGEIIEIPNEDQSVYTPWMVTDFTSEDKLLPKAKIEKCNFDLQVKTDETKTLLGYDDFNAPVYDTTPSYVTLPAILRNTIGNISLNAEINLPSERMYITVKYDDITMYIKEDDTFPLYRTYELQRRDYKVVGIDYSNVFSDKGIITLVMERVVNP